MGNWNLGRKDTTHKTSDSFKQHCSSSKFSRGKFGSFANRLLASISLGGLGCFTLLGVKYYWQDNQKEHVAKNERDELRTFDGDGYGNFLLYASKFLPMKTATIFSKYVFEVNKPRFLSLFMLRLYAFINGIDLTEFRKNDIKEFINIQDLFSRDIDMKYRNIDANSPLVSPCDGIILDSGKVNTKDLPTIKGKKFDVQSLLSLPKDYNLDFLLKNPKANCLYFVAIYLRPKDYHHFHSPCDFIISERKHVKPDTFMPLGGFCKKVINKTLSSNERVIYNGTYVNKFISMTAISATLVEQSRLILITYLSMRKKHTQ